MVHPEDRHRWLTPVQTIDRKSSINNVEFRIITKHGDTRWINQTCRPIFDKNGSFIGSRGSNGDITEQKVAEAKIIRLSNLYAALSQSNHAIMHIKDRNKLFQ